MHAMWNYAFAGERYDHVPTYLAMSRIFTAWNAKALWYYSCMNRLDSTTRAQVIRCLIDGCSIRATVRIANVAKKTVMRLLVEIGDVCADYQDRVFRNLRCRRLQLDETWSWIYCRQKNRAEKIAREHPDAGDIWLWVCIDAETKLVPTWMLGARDTFTARGFIEDIAKRVRGRIQITTDAFKVYLNVIEDVFGYSVDYATLQKIYGASDEPEKRYSPAKCMAVK